jgi:hypothetical protein
MTIEGKLGKIKNVKQDSFEDLLLKDVLLRYPQFQILATQNKKITEKKRKL